MIEINIKENEEKTGFGVKLSGVDDEETNDRVADIYAIALRDHVKSTLKVPNGIALLIASTFLLSKLDEEDIPAKLKKEIRHLIAKIAICAFAGIIKNKE